MFEIALMAELGPPHKSACRKALSEIGHTGERVTRMVTRMNHDVSDWAQGGSKNKIKNTGSPKFAKGL